MKSQLDWYYTGQNETHQLGPMLYGCSISNSYLFACLHLSVTRIEE